SESSSNPIRRQFTADHAETAENCESNLRVNLCVLGVKRWKQPHTKDTKVSRRRCRSAYRLLLLGALRGWRPLRAQQREQDHIANGARVGQKHRETIDPEPVACCRRHAIRQRADIVLVHGVCLLVPARLLPELLLEPAPLLFGIVQLA